MPDVAEDFVLGQIGPLPYRIKNPLICLVGNHKIKVMDIDIARSTGLSQLLNHVMNSFQIDLRTVLDRKSVV
jgi:hypothetical protein